MGIFVDLNTIHIMKLSFKQLNLMVGWLTFGIALFTYISTLEPTVSFWDCGEYIATSVKLQVGHPPGAPVFQLVGNVFSHLAFGNVERQAFYVNLVSGLSSAFTIPFLFWTIVALGRKLFESENLNRAQEVVLLGAGAVGALSFTFSDTFWFSAVEGEVYAMSSCFTAIAFWAVLKWEAAVDKDPYANRWLLLIAYLTGLSVGVHILVFLTIPSVVMIYFYKKYPVVTRKTWIYANGIAVGVLGLVFALIIPYFLKLIGFLEIKAVNGFGLPHHSGVILTVLILGAGVFYGIQWARKNRRPLVSQAIHAIVFILIGYSSFAVLAIRSNANTPIDENSPEDAMSLLSYYKREQYGDWPVLYGQSFNSSKLDAKKPYSDISPTYKFNEESGEYDVIDDGKDKIPNYASEDKGFFPRMWTNDNRNGQVDNYVKLTGVDPNKKISFWDHFGFFMDYQVGQMWFRYFMWNYSGRQNDDQNHFELTKGNWITGISFIDEARLGPQQNLPSHWKSNPTRNVYFALPFLLGLLGVYFQVKRDKRNAWVVSLLFFFTGLAIVIYTNHRAFEPRERDYAFVGSFYVFAIWIGLGVIALFEGLKKYQSIVTAYALPLILLGIPALMAAENWDDHDRSDRFVAREMAKMYLDSCEPNAILFTAGDNDTFPLWYVQEVEGYRTDVKIVNTELLSGEAYIDMMKRKYYEGDPIPGRITYQEYLQNDREVLVYAEPKSGKNSELDIDELINNVKREDDQVFLKNGRNKKVRYFTSKKISIPIDKTKLKEHYTIDPADANMIEDKVIFNVKGDYIRRNQLVILDIIASNDWVRPIYFTGPSDDLGIQSYLHAEGLVYRFLPVKSGRELKRDVLRSYEKMYNPENEEGKFNFGNLEHPDVFLDETVRRSSSTIQRAFQQEIEALLALQENQKALQLLHLWDEKVPMEKFGLDQFNIPYILYKIEKFHLLGETAKSTELQLQLADYVESELAYYSQFKGEKLRKISDEINLNIEIFRNLVFLDLEINHPEIPLDRKTRQPLNLDDFGKSEMGKRFMAAASKFPSLLKR